MGIDISSFPPHIRAQIDAQTRKPSIPLTGIRAKGLTPTGEKNKTEQWFEDEVLKPQLLDGRILWYAFESFKVRIAKATYYTPDFLVLPASLELTVYEVKGHWRDDARVKFKAAAEIIPVMHWIACIRKRAGYWEYEKLT